MEVLYEVYRIDVGRQARVTYDGKKKRVFPNAERCGGELAEASQTGGRGGLHALGTILSYCAIGLVRPSRWSVCCTDMRIRRSRDQQKWGFYRAPEEAAT